MPKSASVTASQRNKQHRKPPTESVQLQSKTSKQQKPLKTPKDKVANMKVSKPQRLFQPTGSSSKTEEEGLEDLVILAVQELKDVKGSTVFAIKKYIGGIMQVNVAKREAEVKKCLATAVKRGDLSLTGTRYKVGPKFNKMKKANDVSKGVNKNPPTASKHEKASIKEAVGKKKNFKPLPKMPTGGTVQVKAVNLAPHLLHPDMTEEESDQMDLLGPDLAEEESDQMDLLGPNLAEAEANQMDLLPPNLAEAEADQMDLPPDIAQQEPDKLSDATPSSSALILGYVSGVLSRLF